MKNKRTDKRQPNIYNPKWMTSRRRESFEEDEFSSEEDTQSSFSFEEELNSIAKRSNEFGPKIVYE